MRNLRFAVALAVAAGCAQPINDVGETKSPFDHLTAQPCGDLPTMPMAKLALRDEMRRLWTDHVAFTRFYIIESIADLQEAPITAARLLRNQDEIGAAIKPFYGDAAGDALAALLRDHITGAVAVLDAAKAGNPDQLGVATEAWYLNANLIARFLADANPNLAFADVQAMMKTHLDQTILEATSRLSGDFEADVRAFDAIVAHILDMADGLTDAIATQFPDKVDATPVDAEDLHLQMRALWEDHVIWTRVVIISAIAHGDCATTTLGDYQAAVARLLRNQDDLGNALRPSLGDATADQLTLLLRDHITIAADIIAAAKANDTVKLGDASARWYANGDQIGALLAGVLELPVDDVQAMMRAHLDQTLAEATDHLTFQFEADIADYDGIVLHILGMADTISASISAP